MSDNSAVTRANLLAQMASDASVTTDLLADEERQFEQSRLAGPPPVERLGDSESPAFALTNEKRGIGLGSKRRTTEPDSDRGTVVLVTGRRLLCLVGSEPDDEVIEVPYDSVASVTSHTGWLANRLEVRTPMKAYHCWVDRNADETVRAAAEFVEQRAAEDPTELTRRDGASRVTYRGQPADNSNGGSPSGDADRE